MTSHVTKHHVVVCHFCSIYNKRVVFLIIVDKSYPMEWHFKGNQQKTAAEFLIWRWVYVRCQWKTKVTCCLLPEIISVHWLSKLVMQRRSLFLYSTLVYEVPSWYFLYNIWQAIYKESIYCLNITTHSIKTITLISYYSMVSIHMY